MHIHGIPWISEMVRWQRSSQLDSYLNGLIPKEISFNSPQHQEIAYMYP